MNFETYDGLCGIIHLMSTSDIQVRCSYEFGHKGPHSWKQIPGRGTLFCPFTHTSTLKREQKYEDVENEYFKWLDNQKKNKL